MRSIGQIVGRLSAANSPLSMGARNGILAEASSPVMTLPLVLIFGFWCELSLLSNAGEGVRKVTQIEGGNVSAEADADRMS